MQRIPEFDANVVSPHGNGVGDPATLVEIHLDTVFVLALWSQGDRVWNAFGPGFTIYETGQVVMTKFADDGIA